MVQTLVQSFAKDKMVNNKWKSFIRQFDVDAIKKDYYPSATFELTAFCTLKCPMCFVRIDMEKAETLGGRLRSATEWINMAKQFRDQGGIFLLLTGGEPMMRPDFPEIYEEISRLGLFITLFTNCTTVNDKLLEVLKRRPPSMIGTTIYGASEETYRNFGGNAGSFQRAVDGLDRLLTIPNLAIEVKFNACSENYKDYKGVYELVANRHKLISLDYGSCAPVRGACSNARKMRLSKEQINEVDAVLREISEPVMGEYEILNDAIGNNEEKEPRHDISSPILSDERGLTCNGGKTGIYIAWDGRMYPCDMASYPYAFPFEQGFKEAALDIRRQIGSLIYPERCLTCANKETTCNCIPKAQNEMRDCARAGEKCNYIPIQNLAL